MKNYGDLGGCYPPRPSASVDNTLLDLLNSSYPTQPHSFIFIAKYLYCRPTGNGWKCDLGAQIPAPPYRTEKQLSLIFLAWKHFLACPSS